LGEAVEVLETGGLERNFLLCHFGKLDFVSCASGEMMCCEALVGII